MTPAFGRQWDTALGFLTIDLSIFVLFLIP
jgi:hypothetical protein